MNGLPNLDCVDVEELSRTVGIRLTFFSKGTTSLAFVGEMNGRKILVKLQRPDSPRINLQKEFKILRFLYPFRITPRPIRYGNFEGLDFIVRELAEGLEIRRAVDIITGRHVFLMMYKALTLDRLGIDHGQIQGGKHVIVGDDVWFIDFEKAGFRRTNNLTALLSMLFLGENEIAREMSKKFGLDDTFKNKLLEAAARYKRSGDFRDVFTVVGELLPSSV